MMGMMKMEVGMGAGAGEKKIRIGTKINRNKV